MSLAVGFDTLSMQQLRVLSLSLLIQILKQLNPMADCSAPALMASGAGFNSLSEHTLQVITAQLLCEINANGVGGGGGGGGAPELWRGHGAPVNAPLSANSIYLDEDANALYWWNGTAWVHFG